MKDDENMGERLRRLLILL